MGNKLTVIGAGRVGTVLGRLWAASGEFELVDILNRSGDSARRAAAFIGSGKPCSSYAELRPADVFLLATPDDQIAPSGDALAASGRLNAGSIVFHCSGALTSAVLQSARTNGAAVASIHPIRSFAAPEQVVRDFAGTWCGVEGDPRALALLVSAFTKIGAKTTPIDPSAKNLYHASAVFASNYLVTLLDVARQAYMRAGIAPDTALELMQPLVRETVENVFRLGPEAALTGPIARGDMETVARQQRAVNDWSAKHGALYAEFAELTADLAARCNTGR